MVVSRFLAASAIVLIGASYSDNRVSAAPPADRVEFENASLRIHRVSVGPGERTTAQNLGDGVLIYLTADLEGQKPRADALWQAAGSPPLENRAATRFEALFVELKAGSPGAPASTIPELAPGSQQVPGTIETYVNREEMFSSLIDNQRVTVSRHHVVPLRWTDRYHDHAREAVYVYLRGGEVSGSNGQIGYHHTRRGDFDVLPANQWHTFYNGSNDPIDFVVVWPK
jgi:hypothetical protein